MRILCLFASVFVLASSIAVHAEDRKFPYEAIIDAEDGENVWSGPGAKHYPTCKLNKGERVIVRRHDPGGWCMISPPQGSFSWVRATHVKRDATNRDRGSLIANRVFVHTGSALNADDFTTVQADLSKGDAVEILDERQFNFDDGPQLMLKISPIKGEWRWISRKSIVAADAIRSEPFPNEDPAPRKRNGPVANEDSEPFARPVSTGPSPQEDRAELEADAGGARRVSQDKEQPGKQKLAEIDRQFREMIQQDPPTWDLESLATQYKQLDDDIGTTSMTATIALRLDAVKRYRKIHRDYVDFYKLTTETKRRDAELQAQQVQYQSPSETTGDQRSASTNSELQPMPQPLAQSQVPMQAQAAAPAFDGAGIVQRMAKSFPGGPQFVLLAPDGRMLSYLQSEPGVDLNRYAGRSVGVIGKRFHRNDWNADTINVRALQPVQLRGTR